MIQPPYYYLQYMLMKHVFAHMNQKGGTGKTTTAVHVAHALAQSGHRVLILDLDPQGNVHVYFGVDPEDGTYDLLDDPEKAVADCVQPSGREGIDLICSSPPLFKLAKGLASEPNAMFLLSDRAEQFTELCDVLVVDTPPTLGILSIAAQALVHELTATHNAHGGIVVVSDCSGFSLRGIQQLLNTSKGLKRLDMEAPLHAVLPNRVAKHTINGQESVALLERHFDGRVPPAIRDSVHFGETTHIGKTLYEHMPGHNALQDVNDAATFLINAKQHA